MEEYVQCSRCGKWMVDEDDDCDSEFYVLDNDSVICNECFDNLELSQCDNCHMVGESYWEKVNSNGKTIILCEDCSRTMTYDCDRCEMLFLKEDIHFDNISDRSFCNSCIKKYKYELFVCDSCGEVTDLTCHSDDVTDEYVISDKDKFVCTECGKKRIHRYEYKPRPEFQGKNKLHFGIELEIITKNNNNIVKSHKNAAQAASKLYNQKWLYLKYDSSICVYDEHSASFEIVTHPLTYRWIKNNLNNKMNYIWNIKQYDMYDHPVSCGMHVHVTKSALSKHQILNLFLLLCPKTKNNLLIDVITTLSRRELDSEWLDSCCVDPKWFINKNKRDILYTEHFGYLSVRSTTVEFRFFRSTLNPKIFMQNIEIVRSMLDFTNQEYNPDLNIQGYIDYLKQSKDSEYKKIYRKIQKGR